jgi:hypothetical protein
MNNAFKKLVWILILFTFFTFFTINYFYMDKQLKIVIKQISDTQDRIKSLNSELSKWKNDDNMILEAKKLHLRKMQESEVVILDNENDS